MPKKIELHPFAQRKLNVEFAKLPDKYEGACQYTVLVEGIEIGTLYRAYEEGARIAYGCVGGSWKGGFGWNFVESPELANYLENNNDQSVLWFASSGSLDRLQKAAMQSLRDWMDEPGNRTAFIEQDWMVRRVNAFLVWLERKMAAAQPAQETSLRAV